MCRQGHKKNESGLSRYFQTLRLKYSPVGPWLVHIWVSCDIRLRLMALNHAGGLSLRNVDVFRWSAKGLKPLCFQKIFWSLSSRLSRKVCHSLSAMVSTSVRAADRETKRGRRYWLLDSLRLAVSSSVGICKEIYLITVGLTEANVATVLAGWLSK